MLSARIAELQEQRKAIVAKLQAARQRLADRVAAKAELAASDPNGVHARDKKHHAIRLYVPSQFHSELRVDRGRQLTSFATHQIQALIDTARLKSSKRRTTRRSSLELAHPTTQLPAHLQDSSPSFPPRARAGHPLASSARLDRPAERIRYLCEHHRRLPVEPRSIRVGAGRVGIDARPNGIAV